MANDYATSDDVRFMLTDTAWTPEYVPLLDTLVTRASRAIDRLTGREPGAFAVSADTTRYFTPGPGEVSRNNPYGRTWSDNTLGLYLPGAATQLWVGELAAAPTSVAMSTSGSVTSYTALAATDYVPWPYNALLEGVPYQRLDLDVINGQYRLWYGYPRAVKIVGKFGYSTTAPDMIVQAAITQAMRWFKRGQQAFADTGAIVDLGQLRYTQRLDPDVVMMLTDAGYRRLTV